MTLTRPATVPYIAAWSGESVPFSTLMYSIAVPGLAYVDEKPDDRAHGVLWKRCDDAPGRGRPRFGDVHPRRQLAVMRDLGCQVCGQSADENGDGVLWVLEDNRGDWAGWPSGLMTTHPPVCLRHAREAMTACPHLATGCVAVRVGASEPVAVHGRHFAVDGERIVARGRGVVELDSPRIRWTLGGQLLRSLRECTLVDLGRPTRGGRPMRA